MIVVDIQQLKIIQVHDLNKHLSKHFFTYIYYSEMHIGISGLRTTAECVGLTEMIQHIVDAGRRVDVEFSAHRIFFSRNHYVDDRSIIL